MRHAAIASFWHLSCLCSTQIGYSTGLMCEMSGAIRTHNCGAGKSLFGLFFVIAQLIPHRSLGSVLGLFPWI